MKVAWRCIEAMAFIHHNAPVSCVLGLVLSAVYVFFYSSLTNDLHLTVSTELGKACVGGKLHTAPRVLLCLLLFYRREGERISTLGGSVFVSVVQGFSKF